MWYLSGLRSSLLLMKNLQFQFKKQIRMIPVPHINGTGNLVLGSLKTIYIDSGFENQIQFWSSSRCPRLELVVGQKGLKPRHKGIMSYVLLSGHYPVYGNTLCVYCGDHFTFCPNEIVANPIWNNCMIFDMRSSNFWSNTNQVKTNWNWHPRFGFPSTMGI